MAGMSPDEAAPKTSETGRDIRDIRDIPYINQLRGRAQVVNYLI